MNANTKILLEELKFLKDDEYALFIKNIAKSKYPILGVRIPALRRLSIKYMDIDVKNIPSDYLEENLLFFMIGMKQLKSMDEQVQFIIDNEKRVDTWEITDTVYKLYKFTTFKNDLKYVDRLMNTKKEFMVRFSYLILMNYISKENNKIILSYIKDSDYYYVNMMEAWLLSYMYVVDEEEIYDFLRQSNISLMLKKMTIRKILDSYRVNKEKKKRLKELSTRLKQS